MLLACRRGLVEVVRSLLQDGRVDPAANESQCLREAAQHRQAEIVKLLANDPRVNVSANNDSAMKGAFKRGDSAMVQLLLGGHREDPVHKHWQLFVTTLNKQGFDMVKCFVEHRCVDMAVRGAQLMDLALKDR